MAKRHVFIAHICVLLCNRLIHSELPLHADFARLCGLFEVYFKSSPYREDMRNQKERECC